MGCQTQDVRRKTHYIGTLQLYMQDQKPRMVLRSVTQPPLGLKVGNSAPLGL